MYWPYYSFTICSGYKSKAIPLDQLHTRSTVSIVILMGAEISFAKESKESLLKAIILLFFCFFRVG